MIPSCAGILYQNTGGRVKKQRGRGDPAPLCEGTDYLCQSISMPQRSGEPLSIFTSTPAALWQAAQRDTLPTRLWLFMSMMFRVLSSPYVRDERNAYFPSLVNAKSCGLTVSGRTMRSTIASLAVSMTMTWLL